jgi:hypothetical protein
MVNKHSELLFFQAIGLLKATPQKDDLLGWAIKLNGAKHRLFIPPHLYKTWLKMIKNSDGSALYLRVYPRSYMAKKQEPSIFFQVVSWQEKNDKNEAINSFTLKGLWQFIPQSRLPVLTVYRNKKAQDVTNRYKANHLPVLMRRDDCSPYRYTKNESKESIQRYFIQGEFTYLPERQAFGYKRDYFVPGTESPRYKKPNKLAKEKIS